MVKKIKWWIARNVKDSWGFCDDSYAVVVTKSTLTKTKRGNSIEWSIKGSMGASDLCPRAVHRMLGVKLKPGEVKRIEVTVKEL